MDTIIQPILSRAERGPYRRHSDEFKRAAVLRSLAPGASVSLIARELNINSNQLFTWRKKFGDAVPLLGPVGHLVEVTVAKAPSATLPVSAAAEAGVIVLSVGKAQLRLEGRADPATLALLLSRLLP